MPRSAPVTQADLARHLGVDQSTVSRAFTDPDLVAADLRQRITDAAMSLGYRTNRMARATRLGRTEHLLIVQGNGVSVSTLHAEILAGLHDAVDGTGLQLGILRLEDSVLTDEARLPAVLRDLSADGLLLNYEVHTPPPLTGIIERHRIPAVWLNVERGTDAIRPDDEQSARMQVEHLLALGHRRIAYLDLLYHTDNNRHISRDDRRRGFEQAMSDAGLAGAGILPDEGALPGLAQVDLVRIGLESLQPTAVVTYGAMDAIAVAMAADQLGWAVPGRLSITTISEFPLLMGRRFTTVVNPFRELGVRAVGMLRQRIERPQRSLPSERLPYRLSLGDTSGPAPSDG